MSLKNSTLLREDAALLQRIKVNKKKESGMLNDEGGKRSMNIAEAFEHEKAMAQNLRQKNQRNIMKCKFLFNKLTTLGNLEGVPQMIASQTSEVDAKIKQLEQMLNSKKTQQMKKLRKKVANFLQQINFEVQSEDMDKLEDQIQLILFLIDVFEEKFNQMTAERKEIDEIINRLQRENENDLSNNQEDLKKQNEKLLAKLLKMDNQLQKLKNQNFKKTELDYPPKDYINESSQEQLDSKKLQIERHIKRIEDLQAELNDLKSRYRILEVDLERSKKEEIKLKQRYRVMQLQKNERIKLLEQSLIKNN